MKNKIQKYLAGEREGFSLVELIIVIAIMAILVGVVALAVLPNIEKSKESKDFATLDSVCSALNAAVASTQAKGKGTFDLNDAKDPTGDNADNVAEMKKVKAAVLENLGSGAKTLGCNAAKDAKIYCNYDTSKGVIEVVAVAGADAPQAGTDGKIPDSSVVTSKYNGVMKVSN